VRPARLRRLERVAVQNLLILPIAAATCVATMIGGWVGISLRDRLHLVLAFSAGAVIGVAFFDLLPEAVELGSSAGVHGAVPPRVVLRASAAAAVALYPAFLLVPGFWPKVAVLAGLSLVTATWYPVLQAELYRSLPGQSGTAVSLLSTAGLVGGLGPLAVGFLAGQLGLGWALAVLVVVPVAVLLGAGWRGAGWRGAGWRGPGRRGPG